MGVVTFKSKLSTLNLDDTFRVDYKYNSFLNDGGWNLFRSKSKNLVPLRDILIPFYENFNFEDDIEYNGIPTGKDYIDQFGEIISTQTITKEEHPNRLKYKIDENCVLISSLKGARIPALSFDFDLSNYVFSNAFYVFKLNENWSKKFILYLLRTEKVKNIIDNNIYRGIGISAYKEDDLLKILIPNIDYNIQLDIVSQIQPIETEITNLKNSKLKPIDIINQVFGEEFGFDWEEFEKIKNEKIFYSSLLNYSNNIDCRFGFRFQHKSGKYLMDFLNDKTSKRIKDFTTIPICLGASVSPSQYDEEGDYYYISMATVKKYYFDKEDAQKVSVAYSSENLNKSVQVNDIIMTRSGMAIGKFALIDEEIDGIFADFTMRIRLKGFNPLLAYYYFRSIFFQHLITTHKKGLQNHNIFPSQIQEFPIPDWSETKQTEIVEKIKTQIDSQNLIDQLIEMKQQEINNIIEEAISV